MSVVLTPEVERWIEVQIESGVFDASAEEMRQLLLERVNREQQELQDAIERGTADYEQGRVQTLEAVMADFRRRGRIK